MATKQPAKKTSRVKAAAAKAKEKAVAVKGGGAKHGSGFLEFIRTQGVVGLAVGLAIGTAAGETVKQLVTAFIDPIVALLIGSQEGLQKANFVVEIGDRSGTFAWGSFVSSLITLLAVAFVVYAIVHFMKLDRLDTKKD